MKNIFFYSPYYTCIILGFCVYCVIYLMDHPPPPKTFVEKVKIIKNITSPVLEKPLKTYTITTPRPVVNINLTFIQRLEKELMVGAALFNTVPPLLKKPCNHVNRYVHDVFLFSHEADTLEIRLYELYDVVDMFHIIESDFTFHGEKMEPFFTTKLQYQTRFKKFLPKIKTYVTHENYNTAREINWKMEDEKQKYAISIIQQLPKDHLVIFGHVDELPSRENVLKARSCRDVFFPLNFGIWMPITTFEYKFRTHFPVKKYPYTLGEPTMGYPYQIDGLSRGKQKHFLLGGIHLTNYCYRPNALMKELTATEYHRKITYKKWDEEKYLYKCQYKRIRSKKITGNEPFLHIPWIMKQNPNAYLSWYGKLDKRLSKTIIKQPKKSFTTYKLYNLIKNPKLSICKKYHVIKGTDREPDVRICLDNISPPCNVLSIGIANIWHFDDFMLKQGCRVWSYDPSMKPGNYKRGPLHEFFNIGIGKKDGFNKDKSTLYTNRHSSRIKQFETKTLKTMMKDMNVNHLDVIRIDTEGAEWDILNTWDYSKINQLLIEIHMYNKRDRHEYKILNIPLRLFWSARNGYDNNKYYKDMTRVYELGFLL